MKRIRVGKTVFLREDESRDWMKQDFLSISAAKKFNGLNSRTVESAKHLPPKVEKAEAA